MKKRKLKQAIAWVLASVMMFQNTAVAGSWYQEGNNWFLREDEGQEGIVRNHLGWYQDSRKDWYYLEPSEDAPVQGALRSGWLYEGGNWYFLNTIHDGFYGRAFVSTWQWIDGYCYCFDANGKLYTNCTTPDGYTVDAEGRWTVDGVLQYVPGKGIQTRGPVQGGSSGGSYSSGGSGTSGDHGNSGEETNPDDEKGKVRITVKYIDADTKEVLGTKELTGEPGESVTIEHQVFGGYEILDGQPVEAVFANKDTEIYVMYRKTLFVGNITIQYVDSENQKKIGERTVSGQIGDSYIVHIPAITGYHSVTEEEPVLHFTAEKQTATIEYRPLKEGEEEEQRIVTADNVKVAQADNQAEQEILDEIYDGIFDYRQYEDGTGELAVYEDNPIYQYVLDGRYDVNDVIYIEPTEAFASGMTFIYQSHDDDYSGTFEGYDAEKMEVIHVWQASPFNLFAPGTNVDLEIPAITEENIESLVTWSLAGDENQENTRSRMRSRAVVENPGIAVDNGKLVINTSVNLKELIPKVCSNQELNKFIEQYIDSFKWSPSFSAEPKNTVVRMQIPLTDKYLVDTCDLPNKNNDQILVFKTDITTEAKQELGLKAKIPIIASASEAATEKGKEVFGKIESGFNDGVKNKLNEVKANAKEDRNNAIKFFSLAIQGLDFEDLGLVPLIGVGANIRPGSVTIATVDDMINSGDESAKLKMPSIYLGMVLCLVWKGDGGLSITWTETTKYDFTIGVEVIDSDDSLIPTVNNLSSCQDPVTSDELNIAAKVDEAQVGVYPMICGSICGMVPVGGGPKAYLKFSDAGMEFTAKKTSEMEHWDISDSKVSGGEAFFQVDLDAHVRVAVQTKKGNTPFNIKHDFGPLEIVKLPIWGSKTIENETSITVSDTRDVFTVCDENGKEKEELSYPTIDKDRKYEFICPEYILKEENGKKKPYKVTGLVVDKSIDILEAEWSKLVLPKGIKTLTINADLAEEFECNYADATELTKLTLTGNGNQFSEIDLSKNNKLKTIDIASEKLDSITLPNGKDSAVEDISIKAGLLTELDVSANKALKHLDIKDTDIRKLDISKNENLTAGDLKINSSLEVFVGNGKAYPDKLKWYSDQKKTKSIDAKDCKAGQTIYSANYNGESEIIKQEGFISFGTYKNEDISQYSFQAFDQYGNDISSTWPGYDETTGWISPVENPETGGYSLLVPQYIREQSGPDDPFKVTAFYVSSYNSKYAPACTIEELDFSKAPDVRDISIEPSQPPISGLKRLSLPKNVEKLILHYYNDADLECNIEDATKLKYVNINNDILYKDHGKKAIWDFSHLNQLETLIFETCSEVEVTWPSTKTLRQLNVDGGVPTEIQIEEVDFSGCPNIEALRLSSVDITELDLTHLKKLRRLDLYRVKFLEDLDVSGCPALEGLYMSYVNNLKTFTGNGKVIPLNNYSYTWYADPEKTIVVVDCVAGQTIYSQNYGEEEEELLLKEVNEIEVEEEPTESLSTPSVPNRRPSKPSQKPDKDKEEEDDEDEENKTDEILATPSKATRTKKQR